MERRWTTGQAKRMKARYEADTTMTIRRLAELEGLSYGTTINALRMVNTAIRPRGPLPNTAVEAKDHTAPATLSRHRNTSRNPLSPRSRKLMKLLAQGCSTEEITTKLALDGSHHIRTLLAVVCMEAGVKNGEKALVMCLRNGWIKIRETDLGVPIPTRVTLTPRVNDAFALFLEGERNDTISRELGITTAYTLTARGMKAINARSQYHAIAIGHVCARIRQPLTS